MAQSLTDIANLAILHCGISKPIANIDTEKSIEAQSIRIIKDIARQTTLRSHPWLFAKKFTTPGLVAGPIPMATVEWTYAYQLPPDALRMVRFVSTRLNNDTRQSRIPFTQVPSPTGGLLIYSNWPGNFNNVPVTIEYTFDNQIIGQWTADFILALSYFMAYLITPVLTRGDPYQLQQKLLALFDAAIKTAVGGDANEEQRPEEPQSEFVRARDGYGSGNGNGQSPSNLPSANFTVD